MSSGTHTERCWTKHSGWYSSLWPSNTLPVPRAGKTTFSVQIATSGIANQFWMHCLQIAQSIVTYIISSGMPIFGDSVHRTNLEIMLLLTSNTLGGTTTYIERSAIAITRAANTKLFSHHIPRGFNDFRHICGIMSDLPKLDLLHTIQISMLENLQNWIFHFMKMHEPLDQYNAICLSLPAYHDLTPKNKSYEEVPQWDGKEMKEMSWYLDGVVTQSLRGRCPAQCPRFHHAILWIRAFKTYICMLNIHLTKMQHWATLRTSQVVFTPCKMFSYLGELAPWRRRKPMPWERDSWTRESWTRKQMLTFGCRPTSSAKWTPSGIISAMGLMIRRS